MSAIPPPITDGWSPCGGGYEKKNLKKEKKFHLIMRPENKTAYYRPPVEEKEEIHKEPEEIVEEKATEDKFICEICGKEFDTEKGLKLHVTKSHKELGVV